MYSTSVSSSNADALAEAFSFPDLQEHTIPEIEAWTARLADCVDKKGRAARELTKEEAAFIQNERILTKSSFPYWAERYAFCSTEGVGIKRMYPLFDSQHLILRELARLEDKIAAQSLSEGIAVNILKARRLGASTFSEAAICHRLTTQTYLYGVIASDVPAQSSYTFGMLRLMYERLPWWLRPALRAFSNTYPDEYTLETGSQLWCHAGQSVRGVVGERGQLGRGKGVSLIHLTELSTWEDTAQIDSALLPTLPYNPRALAFFESSPRGRNNWWHKHWVVSLEGHGQFSPIFIPWYAEPRKYRRPAPDGWSPSETTLSHARRCEDQGPRWLHVPKVSLTRDQLYWYETTRRYYAAKDVLTDFLQEYAADPEECFVFSGRSLVPISILQRITDQARPLITGLEIAPLRDIERALLTASVPAAAVPAEGSA